MNLPHAKRYILCMYVPATNGKTNKLPLNPQTLKTHNPLDESIHLSYEQAKQRAHELGSSYGIGFVFLKQDNYFFIDLDNCLQNDNTWNDTALNSLSYFPGAYVEVSQSGRGLHIIGRYTGQSPINGKRLDALGIEIYTDGRFCALTQTHEQGNAETDHTLSFNAYLKALNITESPPAEELEEWTTEDEPGSNVPQDNAELVQFILNRPMSKNEAFGGVLSIRDLWENNTTVLAQHFPAQTPGKEYDYSAADAALAYRLLYFAGRNCQRVLELMNLSKLKRDKWDHNTNYLPRTISNARRSQRIFFSHARSPQTQADIIKNGQDAQYQLNKNLLVSANYPEISNRGKTLDTAENLKFLLDTYGIQTRWNTMKREREITIPHLSLFHEDEENYALNIIKDLALNNEMPITRIDEHLDYLAQQDYYHPIVEGLKLNPWDGVSRLDAFINTLDTTNPTLSYTLVKRWMLTAIAAAHSEKGFSSHGVLVLAGEQNIGKTRFIKSLDPFNCSAVKTGATLDPKDKDCVRTLSGFWIAELGELDGTFRKADIARLKSFITEDSDKIRFPYAKKDSILPRRTVFAATVNDTKFLVDETGNRRWWTIHVLSVNNQHNIDMVQVWAEVYSLWSTGEQTWMTDSELHMLNDNNKSHEQTNPLEELLYSYFDFSEGWESKPRIELSATEVLRHFGIINPTKSQCTQMGKIISKATGKPPIKRKFARYHLLSPCPK